MTDKKQKFEWKSQVKNIIVFSIIWVASYGGMYIFKWVLSSLVLHQNTIKIAIKQLFYRADSSGGFTKLGAINRNIDFYFGVSGKIMMLAYTAYVAIKIFINRKKYHKKDFLKLIPIAMLVVAPYAWYAGLSNHSAIHTFFTFRIQAVTLVAYLSGTLWFIEQGNKKNKTKIKK